MLSILAVVLGLVIIISAVAADRSARARRPFRAIVLNLCGIGCLALGLLSVYAWSHHDSGHRTVRVAVASNPSAEHATMVRLVVGSNGQLVVSANSDGDSAAEVNGTAVAEMPPEDPTTPLDEPTTIDLGDLESETFDSAEDTPEKGALDVEIAKVEIDFDARPEWVDQPDRDLGEVRQISVASGPFTSLRSARKELYQLLKTETDEYINEVVGNPHAAHWVGYDVDEIRHRFVAPDRLFDEKVISPSFGVMHQSHALLEFRSDFHAEVERAWHQVMARAQLVKVALAGGAILGMLVLLFGYFNADTATRGFYSGRLKFVTAVAILAVIATGFLIARSIPWLWL